MIAICKNSVKRRHVDGKDCKELYGCYAKLRLEYPVEN